MEIIAIKQLPAVQFRRITGVKPSIFNQISTIVKAAFEADPTYKKCRPHKLSVDSQVFITLLYYRSYGTFLQLGAIFSVGETTAWRTVLRVENILSQHPDFQLKGKNKLAHSTPDNQTIAVDATESFIERPKHQQQK